MDLSLLSLVSVAPKARKEVLPPSLAEFAAACCERKVRITYTAWTRCCIAAGIVSQKAMNIPTAGIRWIHFLPVNQQYVVCRKGGGYDSAALAEWESLAPAGFQRYAVADDDSVVAAFTATKQ